ncbi:tetratricopeptide repeat protein [Mastigocladopsis repens]|uniref:tetratricopeptide repeat protein n=1 Tax=Mastigocladopsis repens TaxID=221287 RepID=UPI0003030914|nr:tetratricopeptide repeat protein [Mastigocladopsis repens]
MDWITLLRSLQSDFIKRLTSGCLLHCETEGQYSELTVISGERLKTLREFCWQMAEKYKRTSAVRDVFISNLKGKLGEEVVKERLADFVTEVDYEKRFGVGDGKVDFTLTFDSSVGIAVKSRHGNINKVRWSINSEEVQKNAVVVCILIQEEVNEAQPEYHLFLAGFLPTQMIKLKTGKISFGIGQLLYGGGLRCYLEQLESFTDFNSYNQKPPLEKYNPKKETSYQQQKQQFVKRNLYPEQNDYLRFHHGDMNLLYVKLGDECFEKGQYNTAINHYNQALKLNFKDADIYYKRGLAHYQLGDYEGAIADYTQAIRINPYYGKVYNKIGLARYQLGDYEGAIADYTQAIRMNPHDAIAYRNRAEVRYHIGDYQGAIEDYTQANKINPNDDNFYDKSNNSRLNLGVFKQPIDSFPQAIKMSPNDAIGYKNRGNARYDQGDYQGAIEDYTQAIKMNPNDVDAYYNRGNVLYDQGDYQGAIEDYTQAIKMNPNDADAYYNRGNARYHLGDKQGVIDDFHKAADLYRKEGKLEEHKNVRERILDLEIEESLDILNF